MLEDNAEAPRVPKDSAAVWSDEGRLLDKLVELRRENTRLRMERELLKRAVAFWVRESDE